MEKVSPAKPTKEDKPETKDMRSNPPTKVKLPTFNKPGPPPVKEKPNKLIQNRTNGDAAPASQKQPEEKEADQFDGVDVQTEKLTHPTANRAKPPQRRPPSALATAAAAEQDTENLLPTPAKSELPPKTPPPTRPTPPKVVVDGKTVTHKKEPTLESLQAEIKELSMALELIQTRHERDMQEVKEELKEERNKRLALQEEVQLLKMKH